MDKLTFSVSGKCLETSRLASASQETKKGGLSVVIWPYKLHVTNHILIALKLDVLFG